MDRAAESILGPLRGTGRSEQFILRIFGCAAGGRLR
nr:MAG TPA: hypothetical protein [Caudoviricetes sp.]